MMKKQQIIISFFAFLLLLTACKDNKKEQDKDLQNKTEKSILSLNGAVSAIVAKLGYVHQMVGRDVTSTYPDFVRDSVKDLGHVRSLTIEPVMALQPDLILATKDELPNDLEKSIKDSGIDFKIFEQDFSIEGTKKLIAEVADLLGEKEKAKPLIDKIDQDLSKVEAFEHQPKVLFVYARGAGTLMVAGEDTQMTKMIKIAGGENAINDFKNFKPLTEEALVKNNPDVILLFKSGLQSLSGKEGLIKAVPAISQTNAGKNKAIITMDGGLLSDFGPRVGEAAYQLNQLLKPYAK